MKKTRIINTILLLFTVATLHGAPAYAAEPRSALGESRSAPEEEAPTDEFILYDIALSEDLQRFTFDRCQELGLDYEMVLAVMYKESGFRTDAIGGGNCYGLMQIHEINYPALSEELGVTDLLDPEQNITAGTFMLANLAEKYDDPHKILMAYNCGESGARKLWNQGITSTAYSRGVIDYADGLEKRPLGE